MNFFAQQDQARRNTRWLVGLYLTGIFLMIAITNVVVAIFYWLMDGQLQQSDITQTLLADARQPLSTYFTWQNFGTITALVSGAIFVAVAFKWLQLRRGGKSVAEALGGTRILPNTEDAEQRKILNVVEEMALAANMPVPSVYLLQNQKGINAFAAGLSPSDAVIGITQGAIEQLDREQLQGVVAHEFSHILNGDMRLNLQMIALLNGIIFISSAGEFLMRSGGSGLGHYSISSRRSGDMRLYLLGIIIFLLGSLGVFFAELIKAAVSRQREFLADASAVQFTRNPDGIAGALKIIAGYEAGSRVFSTSTMESNHLFIANGLGSLLNFASHPPLTKRIRRIDPTWNGEPIKRKIKITPQTPPEQALHDKQYKREAALAATAAAVFMEERSQNVETTSEQTKLQQIIKQAHEPFGATALLYGMLFSDEPSVQTKQLAYIQQNDVLGLSIQVQQYASELQEIGRDNWLSIIEQALPALRMLSQEQYKQLKNTLLLLGRADQQFDIFEWCLFELVRHYLAANFEPQRQLKPQFKHLEDIQQDYQQVLSMLAHHGHNDGEHLVKERAFHRGANAAGLYNLELLSTEQYHFDDFVKAVQRMARCYPLIKPRLLKGLADCVRHDGIITTEEREIISAIAAVMDCPLPDIDEL